ncbi:hypothetical protein GCM10027059_19660 [Myceligenerans halotolerans]
MEDGSEEVASVSVPLVDTSRAPHGERAARALVDAVAAGDDRLERYYLEVKGTLDLTSARDRAKLAKFILGAGNRMPDRAAKAFDGHAVMVIGVVDGQAAGVPPVEVLDIEKAVMPFIGADGPNWDLIRVPVPGSENDVLLLIVDPPQWGQPPFPCLKDGAGLFDGDVYVRTDGETRKAKAGEIKELSRRVAAGAAPAVGFDVDLIGEVVPVTVDTGATLEAYLAAETRRLFHPLPGRAREEPEADGADRETPGRRRRVVIPEGMLEDLADLPADESARRHEAALAAADRYARRTERITDLASSLGSLIEPESRSEDEYRAQAAGWREQFRAAWPEAKERLISMRLASVAPRVVNLEEAFLHDVELVMHLEGDVRGVRVDTDHDDNPTLLRLGLPRPPRTWGPRPHNLLGGYATVGMIPAMPALGPYVSQVRALNWENTGSVTLTFDIGDLRPRATYVCPDSDLILVVDDPEHAPVSGTWEITARGHNKVYSGQLSLPIGAAVDLTPEFIGILGLPNSEDED